MSAIDAINVKFCSSSGYEKIAAVNTPARIAWCRIVAVHISVTKPRSCSCSWTHQVP
ncbi:hypothetical protein Pcac1_g6955 [Phytophthora cactorum]|nr:hypothetical protein Pcac1_g6955 [Phytophthora cactorum]KAG2886409.1 hypothetical protein PC114_g19272 [Phytophthora cactorum]KAG2927786.1 hypothetical protein PC117_g14504 [Phytophthora cactorum]KAG3006913.1 hypothetical protein PC119_g14785 [Phytophthora cactorum]KAG3030061.1 hypothetical protein PC120_g3978 [Phytophthora cactorum]